VVGATKQHNWTSQQALAELGRTIDPGVLPQQQHHQPQQQQGEDLQPDGRGGGNSNGCPEAAAVAREVTAAAQELLNSAAALWPAVLRWRVAGIRSGVRALPPRAAQGALPTAGRWMGWTQSRAAAAGGGGGAGGSRRGLHLQVTAVPLGLGERCCHPDSKLLPELTHPAVSLAMLLFHSTTAMHASSRLICTVALPKPTRSFVSSADAGLLPGQEWWHS